MAQSQSQLVSAEYPVQRVCLGPPHPTNLRGWGKANDGGGENEVMVTVVMVIVMME